MTALAQQLKTEGQERALRAASPDDVAAFMATVAAVPAGVEFSVNLVRTRLDLACVPVSARASLFARALLAELIEPVIVRGGGREVHVTEPSTGTSARRAQVNVYRRTRKAWDGSP